MKKILMTLIMTLVLALGCACSAFAAENNLVGYVDVERVFRSYPDMQSVMSVIDLEGQKAQNEFEQKAATLDDNGKKELSQKLSERIAKKKESLLSPIRSAIRKAIGEVAKAHGITNVVDASVMVFGGYDLTEEVMARVSSGK